MTMTSRKPTPLKDEKPDPVEELQEQMTELIAAVNSLAEKGAATAECRPDERLRNSISTAVVKAVQDLLETRRKKFEEAEKDGMTVNEAFREILVRYDDICEKAKAVGILYQKSDSRFKNINENLQKICDNEKLLHDMMNAVLQAHNIKNGVRPNRPGKGTGFKKRLQYFACALPLYGIRRGYRSRHVRLYTKICLFCIWVITIAAAGFIAYDNSVLRKENKMYQMLRQYLQKDAEWVEKMKTFDFSQSNGNS